MQKAKELEHEGYQFESADASFELMALKILHRYTQHFTLGMYRTSGEFPHPDENKSASAMLSIQVGDVQETTAAMGNGPVHALDTALRKALSVFYPALAKVRLVDYKVRVLTGKAATASRVRVLIESSDGELDWTTTGRIHGYHRGQLGSADGFDRILSASKGGFIQHVHDNDPKNPRRPLRARKPSRPGI